MENIYSKDKESIGTELLHYINSLIEPLVNESLVENLEPGREVTGEVVEGLANAAGGRKSISKEERKNTLDQEWVVGIEAADDLRDIIKLLKREIDSGAESERYAISLLCEWNVINNKLIPLWRLTTDNIEIQSLIVQILFWLTMPPDENWRKFHSKSTKCKSYLRNIQRIKFSLCSTGFWKEVVSLYDKLNEVVQNNGFLREDKDELKLKEQEILALREQDEKDEPQVDSSSDVIETIENSQIVNEETGGYERLERLERLEMIRSLRDDIILINEKAERRLKQFKSRIGMIKGLLIQTLKIQDPVTSDSLSLFGVRSVHMLLISKLLQGGIIRIIQEDMESLLTKENLKTFDEAQKVTPWRILEYIYGLVCGIQPIDFVNELFGIRNKEGDLNILRSSLAEKIKQIKKNSSSGFTSNSLMNRHSRFNPMLARKRIKENNGGIACQVSNSKHSSRRVVKYRYDFDVDEVFEYLDIFLGAMQSTGGTIHSLEMYGFPTIEGCMEAVDGLKTQSYKDIILILGEFLEDFFKSKLPVLIEMIFIILRSGSEKHTIWDVSRLISLITWVLAYKRTIFYQVIKDEKDKNIIKEELTRMLMETRYLLDTKKNMTFDFIFSTIKLHAKEKLLKGKSHKVVRISLRCLNEQLKIVHLVSNSEVPVIRELGISIISFITRMDTLNCLSWILKHFSKTSHHPELFLYSVEVSNRLIKLISKLGSETVISTKRRRKDRPTDLTEFVDEEEFVEDRQELSGFEETYYSEKTKLMSLDEMMGDFCDGRIVSKLMMLISNYSTNHSNVNWHVSRLARKIITTRPPGKIGSRKDEEENQENFMQLFCGLFFQLSYFIIFAQILSDKNFQYSSRTDKGAQDVILLARHVIHQFWEVARVNKFVFVELLFSKNSARGLGLADPERLRSIFTNYEEGIDAAIVERMNVTGTDAFEAKSFVRNKVNKEKQASGASEWSKNEDEELLTLFSQYKENPKCITIIASLLSNMKSERSVKKRLRDLGKISQEKEPNQGIDAEDIQQEPENLELLNSIIGFIQLDQQNKLGEDSEFDPNVVLSEIFQILDDSHSTREIIMCGVEDIPIDLPSELPLSVFNDPSYIKLMKSLGLKENVQTKRGEEGLTLWMIPKEMTQKQFRDSIDTFKSYIGKDEYELMEISERYPKSQEGYSKEEAVKYSEDQLKNTVQDFLEDSSLSCGISEVLDDSIPRDNGLLHLILGEMQIIIAKNGQEDWLRTEIEDICICLTQERFDQLGIRKEYSRIADSNILKKLLRLLGLKRSQIQVEVQILVHLERGISPVTTNNKAGDGRLDLEEETSDCNLFEDDFDPETTQENVSTWIVDFEKITFREFVERTNLLKEFVVKFSDFKGSIGAKSIDQKCKFSKKMISNLCKSIYHLRIAAKNSKFIQQLISKLGDSLPNNCSEKSHFEDAKRSKIETNYLLAISYDSLQGPESKFIIEILQELMAERELEFEPDESLDKSPIQNQDKDLNQLQRWSIKGLVDNFDSESIQELIKLLIKLTELDIEDLKKFTEKITGKKLKLYPKDEVNKAVNKENIELNNSDKNSVDELEKPQESEDSLSEQGEYRGLLMEEGDKRWRSNWEELQEKMKNVSHENLFQDEEEVGNSDFSEW
ncbi:SANT domain containing protein [Cryptosporidium felis]|nr:SANT domain containing protein [Cryptosporidium felis]